MSRRSLCLVPLLLAAVVLAAAEQGKAPAPPATTASGVFVGRSGKPMAKARLTLGEVVGDDVLLYAKIKLPSAIPTVTTDDKGQFQFQGFPAGTYTIVYQPAGAGTLLPPEIAIRGFSAMARSFAPELRDMEVGKTGEPYPQRVWGATFTLLKGHTFWLEGANMKVWNATARWRQHGVHLEIRRGLVWMQKLADKSQIKLDAWSF